MKCYLKKLGLLLLIAVLISAAVLLRTKSVSAETEEEKLQRLSQEIQQYENEIKRLSAEADTLSNQVAQYDAQIKLTLLKISQTEEKINLLGGRIDQLEISVSALGDAFSERASKTYKMSRFSEGYMLFLQFDTISDAFSSFHYLKRIQQSDVDLLERLNKAKVTYEEQKSDQETLQNELIVQQKSLNSQKTAKAKLLEQTKNDEKKYQQLLASARSEYEAIVAIISGKGTETRVGHVNEGDRIASVIQGPSCNSSGEHLHFIVSTNGAAQNPFNYLRGGIGYENCSGSACGSSDGDPFNPSGSWSWPLNEPIKYSQGFGSTWAVRNTWVGRVYSFHNGIDIDSNSSPSVKAVKAGELYRGSFSGSNGCALRYVKVNHDDSDLETYYLHINY
ncbi:MAG TPA: hypothetical protein VI819_02135 [Patescibacteria group bacterium]|nr:hypothetical protein [Patescibacteria group bacterium]